MVATLAYRDILQKQTQTRTSIPKQSVLIPTDHRTDDSTEEIISGVYLRISSSYCFQLFDLFALSL